MKALKHNNLFIATRHTRRFSLVESRLRFAQILCVRTRALLFGNEAMARAEILALRVLAERLEHNESGPQAINISIPA